MSVAISAKELRKTYRDGEKTVEVLKGVDLEIEKGDFVAVVGPSGSGKSTLLHLLGALDSPDSGSIRIEDTDISCLSATEIAGFRNRMIGFVFQFQELLADFTALENVTLPGRIARWTQAEVEDRARSLLSNVGLQNRLDFYPSQLSGGERQRVALCRALLLRPPLLLADEPTGNLDPTSGERVFDLMLEMQKSHETTALVVTHNPELAKRCAKLFVLEDGVLRQEAV